MESLSIVASAVNIVDFCWKISDFLVEVKRGSDHVDESIKGLIQETEAIRAVAGILQQVFSKDIAASQKTADHASSFSAEDEPGANPLWQETDNALRECLATLEKLEALVKSIRGSSSDSTSTMERVRRYLRKMSKEDALHDLWNRLSKSHQKLQTLLTAISIVDSRRSEETSKQLLEGMEKRLREQIESMTLRDNDDLLPDYADKRDDTSGIVSAAKSVLFNKHFLVPQHVSRDFRGRETALEGLMKAFQAASTSQETRRFVIYGIGGSGKTQFCCKFARDNQEKFWGVFYVDATSDISMKDSIGELAESAKIRVDARAVKKWLSVQALPWLLLVDNADREDDTFLDDYVPERSRGLVLITTRSQSLKTMGNLQPPFYHFAGLQEEASSELLLVSAGQKSPFMDAALRAAKEICSVLGHLPLAVLQAGRAIRNGKCSLKSCIAFFREKLDLIRSRTDDEHKETDKTVFSTYEMLIGGVSDEALEVLKLLSFMHCKRFRLEIFLQAVSNPRREMEAEQEAKRSKPEHQTRSPYSSKQLTIRLVQLWYRLGDQKVLPKIIRQCEGMEFDKVENFLRKSLWQLQDVALVDYSETDDSYSIHPLIHWWARERMKLAERNMYCHFAVTILAQATSLPPFGAGAPAEQLRRHMLPHIEHVRKQDAIIQKQIRSKRTARRWPYPSIERALRPSEILVRAKFALAYYENGSPMVAAELMDIVDEWLCVNFGLTHPRTMKSRIFRSEITRFAGNENKAAKLQFELLEACETVKSNDDEDLLQIMDELGLVLWQQGKFDLAYIYSARALQGFQKIYGSCAPQTWRTMTHMGMIVGKLGRFDEAVETHERALRGLEAVRLQDPNLVQVKDILEATENMAMARYERSRYGTAQPKDLDIAYDLETKVFKDREDTLGERHHMTLIAACHVARIKAARGAIEEAEAMFDQKIPIAVEAFGPDHFGTLFGKMFHGHILILANKLDQAQGVLEEVVAEHEKNRRDHPDQLVAAAFLLRCYKLQGDARAQSMQTKLVQGCRRIFGENSPWEDYLISNYNDGHAFD